MLTYHDDYLGNGFQYTVMELAPDYDGLAIATLVRKKANVTTDKAVLYIHGYIDYFFQQEMALQFNANGYDFYALDLRKYGRSYLPHQRLYHVRDLKEYDEEIQRSIELIAAEGHESILLSGHSTGGLTATYFAARHSEQSYINGLWLNSPFYEFNVSLFDKWIGIPLACFLAKQFPKWRLPNGMSSVYAESLHATLKGEWDFNTQWKPKVYSASDVGFIRAVREAQKVIQHTPTFNIPVLVMHSNRTLNLRKWDERAQKADLVLQVRHIAYYAKRFKGDVTIMKVKDGMHDLVLSSKPVRVGVYKELFDWLAKKGI